MWKNTIGIRGMKTCSSSVIIHANHGGGEPEVSVTEDVNTLERPRIGGSREMATEATCGILRTVSESDERCNELAQVVVECNEVNVEAFGARAREIHGDISYKEMMERWEFLKHLPHQFLRDIGYTIAGPSLLSTSKELPTVNPSTLGGSNNQWPDTKAWLEQLSIPAVEAWFASHKSSQRLGDHFALCIEYVLRHSPQVEVQHLITSQQVLQRLTEPVRNSSKALKALQVKLVGQRDVSDENMLGPCLLPEQQHVSSEMASTDSVDDSIQLLKSMDLGGGPPQERIGKRKRKLLKKLERIRLLKGKTNTIGEFDYLFETPALDNDGFKGKELQHWEVSVKFLLYAGPWEVFGLKSPKSAAWSKPDGDWKRGPFEGSIDNAGTTTIEESNGLHSQDEVDAFLGCYLGPHVGETLLDRKTRLRNQLALSANPCAALLLQDLYRSKGNLNKLRNAELDLVDEEGTSTPLEDLDGGGNNAGEESEIDLYRNKGTSNKLRNGIVEKEETAIPQEDLDGGGNSNSKEPHHVSVVPSALLKGYLFYEYKLWCFLESAPPPSVPDNEPSEKASLNVSHWMGWWTCDIMEFANLPRHQHSKWYIVPKLEWLSPVVIPSSDPDRCARVLCLSDFVLTAAQVAEEAARLQMPRKRRFLVAELRWDESVSSTRGAWLEVSRGFVVEDTWPDSKMYKPHGYWVSWAPSGRVPIHCRRHLDPVDVTVDV